MLVLLFVLATSLPGLAQAQTCENYGFANDSSCACPTGFGGSDCSQPACGGDPFQGSRRPVASPQPGSSFANLTAAGCSCESGWTGTTCSVCQTSDACLDAFNAAAGSSNTIPGMTGLNNTMVCSNSARVWAAGQMSCQVNNPTLQAIYPLTSTLNIIRTLQPNLSPQPNVSSFGGAGSLYAQLFYAGIEQFYCQADSCAQELDGEGAVWTCQNLQCTCRPNTSFCGAVPATNLTAVINGLGGTLTVSCAPPNNDTRTASCSFGQSTLQALFGSGGLPLDGCTFGECVRQSVIDTNGNSTSVSTAHGGSQLSDGVIAGLAVVGGLLLLALSLLALGFWKQRSAKLHGPKNISVGGIADDGWALHEQIGYVVYYKTLTSHGQKLGRTVRKVL